MTIPTAGHAAAPVAGRQRRRRTGARKPMREDDAAAVSAGSLLRQYGHVSDHLGVGQVLG